jgi:uncharacterized RDD family membrane protein YckC
MKCSKCGYLGFDTGDRCRNCGYEFSLSTEYELHDLSIKPVDERPDLDDFALVDAGVAPRMAVSTAGPASPSAVMEPRAAARPTPLVSMPLFAPGIDDDTPLITRPSPPRAPLQVRRSTPDLARLRAATSTPAPKLASLDLGLDLQALDAQAAPRVVPSERASVPEPEPSFYYEDAGVARRFIAAVVDSAILLAIDFVVIYFTMQICGVSIAEFGILPKGPLVAFLVVQNVGYLIAFTAGGQTLGKMAAAIKVVPEDGDATLDIECALKRTVLWLVLVFPAGLGLLSALFDRDHRGLHDRFAGTRVVRATV